jgi:hypothetical protein
VMPSGGSVVRCLYSWKRRFEATEFMVQADFGSRILFSGCLLCSLPGELLAVMLYWICECDRRLVVTSYWTGIRTSSAIIGPDLVSNATHLDLLFVSRSYINMLCVEYHLGQ